VTFYVETVVEKRQRTSIVWNYFIENVIYSLKYSPSTRVSNYSHRTSLLPSDKPHTVRSPLSTRTTCIRIDVSNIGLCWQPVYCELTVEYNLTGKRQVLHYYPLVWTAWTYPVL